MNYKLITGAHDILFDKFEIIEIIKKDQFSAVYISNHIYLNKKIFLKSLNTAEIKDKEIIERFKREAKLLAKMDHDNIIKVYDFGTHENYFYISFEYFDSGNLRSLINSGDADENQKLSIVKQLIKGLKYAHDVGTVHRDLKPENILINEYGEVKIGDFGLAHSINDNFITSQYGIVGTPAYMSPEQVAGQKCSFESDMFSLGIVILELYTNTNPFLTDDINLTINSIINFHESQLSFDPTNIPPVISEIVTGLLKQNPEDRTNNCNILLEKLGEVPEDNNPSSSSKKNLLITVLSLTIFMASVFLIWQQLSVSQIEPETQPPTNEFANNEINPISEKIKSISGNKNPEVKSNKKLNDKNDSNSPIREIPESKTATDFSEDKNISAIPINNNIKAEVISYGNVVIQCFPWADVYIDSVFYGQTPITNPGINLVTGSHKLELINPDFPSYKSELSINESETESIKVNLDSLWAYVNCNIFPWGNIYLNNQFIAETPLSKPLKVLPGKYELIVSNPLYDDVIRKFEVSRNDTFKLNFNFAQTGRRKE